MKRLLSVFHAIVQRILGFGIAEGMTVLGVIVIYLRLDSYRISTSQMLLGMCSIDEAARRVQ